VGLVSFPKPQRAGFEYNSKGNVTRATDPVGRTTLYNYAPNEIDLLEIRQVNGQTTELVESRTYNSQHLPLTFTDAAGQTTTYTYKADGRLETSVTPPRDGLTAAQRTTTYAYYSDTNPTGPGRLQTITAPNVGGSGGPVTSFTYDGYGRVRTATQATDNYTTTTDYDALDRPTRVTYPDGTYDETVYNRLDAERHRDRLGRWSHTFYDALRRVVSTRDPAGRTVAQEWCACGSLERLIDPNNNATSWEYDLQGRGTQQSWPDGKFTSYVYETTTSRLKSVTDPKNQTIQYAYDLDDKLVSISYQNEVIATPDVAFSYRLGGQPSTGLPDIYGRLTQVTDGTGTTTYTYHPAAVLGARRLKDVDGPLAADTVSYTYDELGRVKTRSIGGAGTVTYSYDSLSRLTSQANPVGIFTWAYEGVTGRVLTLDYPNGQRTSYQYFDNLGDRQLKQIHNHIPATSTTISKFDYTYDDVGNILTWQQQAGAASPNVYELGYDAADQLTAAILKTTGGSPTVLKRYGYAYDPAGNRTTEQVDDVAALSAYDTRNRLTGQQPGGALLFKGSTNEPSTVTVQGKPAATAADNTFAGAAQVPSGTSNVEVKATDPAGNVRTNTYQVSQSGTTKNFTYDDNGNLIGDGTRIFEWNAENRLTAVKQGAATLASFVYDANGRRYQKIAGGVTHTFIHDGTEVAEERLGTGGTIRYFHGAGIDQHLGSQDQGGAPLFYVADHLGSIRQVTNNGGSVTLTRDYDSYGSLLAGSSSAGYAFTGREWDAASSLYYYRARYYDPTVGRFLSQDPLGVEVNPFSYVGGNPVAYGDSLGLLRKRFNTDLHSFSQNKTITGPLYVYCHCTKQCGDDYLLELEIARRVDIYLNGNASGRNHEFAHLFQLRRTDLDYIADVRYFDRKSFRTRRQCQAMCDWIYQHLNNKNFDFKRGQREIDGFFYYFIKHEL
jgi:RHS repeat-associated protein